MQGVVSLADGGAEVVTLSMCQQGPQDAHGLRGPAGKKWGDWVRSDVISKQEWLGAGAQTQLGKGGRW